MQYQHLPWDSEFFGVRVARIDQPHLVEDELADILSALRRQQTKLVYWSAAQAADSSLIERLGGTFVDARTTFAIDLDLVRQNGHLSPTGIEPYAASMCRDDLERLAVQSGAYSRFAVDPRIAREKFVSLYKLWINRSLAKEIAREVLVARQGQRVIGMVTLGERNGRGDIGLIAVDQPFRGRQIGEHLVRSAQLWFVEQGYRSGQVVTQGQNTAACKLYAKCGYRVEQVEYYYHFWLS